MQASLEDYYKGLDNLKKQCIVELKTFKKPPLIVQRVVEAVLIMLGKRGYPWKVAQIEIGKIKFFDELINFDLKKVNRDTYEKVRFIIIDERFNYEKVKSESQPAATLCIWLLNIIKHIELTDKFNHDYNDDENNEVNNEN